jgi:hypothetical protein
LSYDDNLIFVSIAAYRDPQLVPTVLDCIAKALRPELLRFGVCWQHDADEEPLLLKDDLRFRIVDVDWRDSKGACWARSEIMKLWQGEDWFLQVDSHCRFAPGWDEMLLQAMTETSAEKPILSTYATPFTPGENEVLHGGPLQIVFQAFTPEGIPQLRPEAFPRTGYAMRPRRARFLSAGFLFAQGCFVQEVTYDPELYFMGEESAMTVRAFTHGYDLFHPSQTIVWHDYIRADARKHWGDHVDTQRVACHWKDRDDWSRRKVQRLLLGEDVGSFGLGSIRTLADYETYAGLSFKHRKAQQYTVRGEEPPNPEAPFDWTDKIYPWIARIRLQRDQLPEGSLNDPQLWNLSILDEGGYEICRRDLTTDELAPLYGKQKEIALIVEFPSETVPESWTLLPMSRSLGWLRRIGGKILEDDVAILKNDEDEVDG